MKYLLKNGLLFTKDGFRPVDLSVAEGRIISVAGGLEAAAGAVAIDLHHAAVFPGFVDVHVHLREPGFSYKETIRTGSLAAARGGYAHVCAMPNLNPIPDSLEALNVQREAYCLNVPVYAARVELQPGAELQPIPQNLMRIDAENVVIETVKKAEDGKGIVVRMYESENSYTKAKVKVAGDYGKAFVCNLLEEEEQEAPVQAGEIAVTLKPYEVVTLKLV